MTTVSVKSVRADQPHPKIVPLESTSHYVNLLVYGKSGVGKTVLAGSDDALIISTEEGGTLSAQRFGSKAHVWHAKKWPDIEEAYDYLAGLGETTGIPYKFVAIDSLTSAQAMCMSWILEVQYSRKPSSRDIDIAEIQDWLKYQNMFMRKVKEFNALPCNMLYTALIRSEIDQDGNPFVLPDIQGKGYQYAQGIAALMTSYGLMEVRTREVEKDGKKQLQQFRQITWMDRGVAQGKDRTRCLAPQTKNLSLKQIRELIEAGPRKAIENG